MLFGAHVSIAGGLINAPKNAADVGCEVFQIFTRSPQGGYVAPLNQKIAEKFKHLCVDYQQKEWVVHTPYFINFASGNSRISNISIIVVRNELERASILGARFLVTHLGSYKDLGRIEGQKKLISGLQKTLKGYGGQTEFLIEISAGAGEIIGDNFEEIASIIYHPLLKKYNIGVCYDTQHGFASGYDIRTPPAIQKTFRLFETIIGLKKIKLIHGNDSQTPLGSHKDRHEHLGKGLIGVSGFKSLLSYRNLGGANLILETKPSGVAEDLGLLKRLRG